MIDLQPLSFRLTLDTATAFLFGSSAYSLRAGLGQADQNRIFSESLNIAQEGLAKRLSLAPFHFAYNIPAFQQACRNVHLFVENYTLTESLEGLVGQDLEEKTKSSDSASLFIHQVAAKSRTLPGLQDQLLNLLLAALDTTAFCLSWTL